MLRKFLLLPCFLLLLLPSLNAWNETGHRLIAAIAYDNLTQQARSRVDALLRRHPDYESMLTKDAPAEPTARARAAFLVAASWPDMIRNDARFYDEARADVQPTKLLPGFLEMGRHAAWHYVDFNFSEDGTPIPPIETPNALGELRRLIEVIGSQGTENADTLAAYSLPWLIHLAGDVHNPLHTVSRYSAALPKGDRGGNDVWVRPSGATNGLNLHAFWDGLGGNDNSSAYVDKYAAELAQDYRARFPALVVDTHPETWIVEGFYNARSVAYQFGKENGTRENPLPLNPSYESTSKALSRERLAAAGMRLAALLNSQLR